MGSMNPLYEFESLRDRVADWRKISGLQITSYSEKGAILFDVLNKHWSTVVQWVIEELAAKARALQPAALADATARLHDQSKSLNAASERVREIEKADPEDWARNKGLTMVQIPTIPVVRDDFPVMWPWEERRRKEWLRLECPKSVPWGFVEPHEQVVCDNHRQTLQRLAQRGGLSVCELVCLVEHRRLEFRSDTAEDIKRLKELLRIWKAQNP